MGSWSACRCADATDFGCAGGRGVPGFRGSCQPVGAAGGADFGHAGPRDARGSRRAHGSRRPAGGGTPHGALGSYRAHCTRATRLGRTDPRGLPGSSHARGSRQPVGATGGADFGHAGPRTCQPASDEATGTRGALGSYRACAHRTRQPAHATNPGRTGPRGVPGSSHPGGSRQPVGATGGATFGHTGPRSAPGSRQPASVADLDRAESRGVPGSRRTQQPARAGNFRRTDP
jgi:hypothetical protein